MSRRRSDSAFVVAVTSAALLLVASVLYVKTNRFPTTTPQQTKLKVKYPRFTDIFERAGNANSVAFLDWARANHITFDLIELDENGDIIRLAVHICYFVRDQDLQAIAKLPRLEELRFLTRVITDSGIQHLEATTTLRTLSIHSFQKAAIPDQALEVLKSKNPALVVEL
ncbi:MAG TPA: hypothetical protein VGM98_17430 [Schlesneria sp.]